MGGEGPYVRFEHGPTAREPLPLDDAQRDKAYTLAHPWLLEKARQLVELGWQQHDGDDTLLASLSCTRILKTDWNERRDRVELRLPRDASAWFEPSLLPQWKAMFERGFLFDARKRRSGGSEPNPYADAFLYVDVETPLRDIFHFLQCLMPDTLVIIRVEDFDDYGEVEYIQRLPSFRWVEEHTEELRPIFGEERLTNVTEAAKKWGCLSSHIPSYSTYDEEREVEDFTACDQECGYCGHCDY